MKVKLFSISDETDDYVHNHRRTISILGITLPYPFPIASLLGSSSAVVLGYPVFGSDNTPTYINYLFKLFKRIQDIKYWFLYRFHPKHQYHIVKTDLHPGYYDVDTIMLEACMKLLQRYIEDECGGVDKLSEWTSELRKTADSQAAAQAEAIAIYNWWINERPNDLKKRKELMSKLYGDRRRISFKPIEGSVLSEIVFDEFDDSELVLDVKLKEVNHKIDDEEQKMLHRLIDIRCTLWT